MTDLLAYIRRAEATAKAQRMSRDQKARFLRDRGWRRMSKSKTQRWQDRDGTQTTLSGAVVTQLTKELNEGEA